MTDASAAADIVYYVSGHGFGHARRSALVIAALSGRGIKTQARTLAPARLLAPLDAGRVHPTEIDAGMVEADALTIDAEASLARLESLVARQEAIVSAEADAIRAAGARLVVADVPFLAGLAALRAGARCVAISNFTWDWICDALFAADPRYARRYADIRPTLVAGYAAMPLALRLPFGELCPSFPRVVAAPLIATGPRRDRAAAANLAGIGSADRRPRILIGMRGGVADATLLAAADNAPDMLFVLPEPAAALTAARANIVAAPPGGGLDFTDLVSACDVVVSKLGFGTVAECIAAGTRMLWPPRRGFVEDEAMIAQTPPYLTASTIARLDFQAGRWGERLRALLAQPPAPQQPACNGADFCADVLEQALALPDR